MGHDGLHACLLLDKWVLIGAFCYQGTYANLWVSGKVLVLTPAEEGGVTGVQWVEAARAAAKRSTTLRTGLPKKEHHVWRLRNMLQVAALLEGLISRYIS